jgi:hypothetical protein
MPHRVLDSALVGTAGHQVLLRVTPCLALSVFAGLLAADPYIGLAIRGSRVRWRRLVQRLGPVGQPRDATERREWPESGEQPPAQNDAALSLSVIELAVVAELNFEIARAHDELAEDASQRLQTRRAAHAKATAIRERAQSLQVEARRRSAQPTLYAPAMCKSASRVFERRTQDRRSESRRRDGQPGVGPPGGRERRTLPDRRKRERRGGVVAG